MHAVVEGSNICMNIEKRGIGYNVVYEGRDCEILVLNTRQAFLNSWMLPKPPIDSSKSLRSPMPGLLTEVLVAPGIAVKAGEKLCIVEAMKMENILRAECDLIIANVEAKPGETLSVDQVILTFK